MGEAQSTHFGYSLLLPNGNPHRFGSIPILPGNQLLPIGPEFSRDGKIGLEIANRRTAALFQWRLT